MRRALPLAALLAGCVEALPDDTPYVDAARVLAVRLDPPEVQQGATTHATALYADASGALGSAPLDWAFCTARKPLAELGPVAPACLNPDDVAQVPLGTGLEVDGAVPADACARFGPNPPPPEADEPGGRPVDPDATGGFYQPLLAFDGDAATLASVRLRCGLANVDQETYVAWNLGYHDNTNPTVAGLVLVRDGVEIAIPEDGAGEPPTVAPGEQVGLVASWPSCPDAPTCGDGFCTAGEDTTTCADDCIEPVGCDGAESYVVFDPDERRLVTRREAVSASWFATGGIWRDARGGRAGDDPATRVDNAWTAPDAPGEAWLWVVLRDERGGVSFADFRLRVGD